MAERVARVATLVRYDHRGFGLSDRDVTDFSVDRLVSDLEAVVDKLELRTSRSSHRELSHQWLCPTLPDIRTVTHVWSLEHGFDRSAGKSWDQWELLAANAASDLGIRDRIDDARHYWMERRHEWQKRGQPFYAKRSCPKR